MSEKEKMILENLGRAIPGMTDLEKERFLGFAEGVAFKAAGEAKSGEEQH